MDPLERILADHVRRYPKMEPTDAVKLIFQNEFGPGHLIPDPHRSLAYLEAEWPLANPDSAVEMIRISEHLVRLSLNGFRQAELAAVNDALVLTASSVRGSVLEYQRKLKILEQLCEADRMSFTPEQLRPILEAGLNKPPVPVHHSETFRRLYHPHYRVIFLDQAEALILRHSQRQL